MNRTSRTPHAGYELQSHLMSVAFQSVDRRDNGRRSFQIAIPGGAFCGIGKAMIDDKLPRISLQTKRGWDLKVWTPDFGIESRRERASVYFRPHLEIDRRVGFGANQISEKPYFVSPGKVAEVRAYPGLCVATGNDHMRRRSKHKKMIAPKGRSTPPYYALS